MLLTEKEGEQTKRLTQAMFVFFAGFTEPQTRCLAPQAPGSLQLPLSCPSPLHNRSTALS